MYSLLFSFLAPQFLILTHAAAPQMERGVPSRLHTQTPTPPEAGVRGGFLYKLGGVSYTIRILMYLACILHVS